MNVSRMLLAGWVYAATALVSPANYLANPDFNQGADGLQGWEGYHLPAAAVTAPSNFVTASAGTALVRGYGTTAGETAFYQTFTAAGGVLAAGSYTWSATFTNITDPAARMFIKVWTNDSFQGFRGEKFQNVALSNGTLTLSYQHTAGDLVQFGFAVYSTNVTEGFDVRQPLLVAQGSGTVVTTAIAAVAGAAPGVHFVSENGVSYTLESTAELAGTPVDWQVVETRVGTGGPLVLGTNAPILDRRLFRVVTP